MDNNLPAKQDQNDLVPPDSAWESQDEEPIRRPPGPLESKPRVYAAFVSACFFCFTVILSLYHWQPDAMDLRASGDAVTAQGEVWRLFTALFVHSDLGHLLSNAPLLALFGWLLCGYFGLLAFPVVSVLMGAMANWITVSYYPPGVRLLGASGMVYSMVGLWLTLYLRFDVSSKPSLKFMRALGFALLMLFPRSYEPRISYMAHGSGFLIGVLFGLLFTSLWRSALDDLGRPHSSVAIH